ncbi:hypothetical protein T01_7644 [Trichinella spiralis]|uniref:Integrase catalytic domain-containing protein n=1 Tax=Trichinella spiralis TaxID=6334 RepID=A0A0V1AX27_TRISP|nr:hypothetical protein T01_7644 [Trichinella spiralis]
MNRKHHYSPGIHRPSQERQWMIEIGAYGVPATIVTNNGSAFQSQEFRDFCRQNGVKPSCVSSENKWFSRENL